MKKLIFLSGIFSLTMLIFASCSNQKKKTNGFSVAINIRNLKVPTKVFLQIPVDGKLHKIDSVTLIDGKGTITGKVKRPELYYLTFNNFHIRIPFWIENSKISVSSDIKNLRNLIIKGSKTQDEYMAYEDSVSGFQNQELRFAQQYRVARMQKKEADMKKAENKYDSIGKLWIKYMIGYAMRHNKSVVMPYIIMRNSYSLTLEQLDSVSSNFDPALAQNTYAKLLKERVAVLKRVAPGQPFVNFTLNDTTGNPVSLASVIKNHKYTLVDFWASWCAPCRAENPNVVAAFKKYHRKGFTVFGVSLDENHSKWEQAIKQDGLDWTQVSDLKGWKSAAAKLYGVQVIPHNVLINEKGIIVAQDLRGPALQAKLKALLK